MTFLLTCKQIDMRYMQRHFDINVLKGALEELMHVQLPKDRLEEHIGLNNQSASPEELAGLRDCLFGDEGFISRHG